MKTHDLKSWPYLFQEVVNGNKLHEMRRCDDRDFSVGDLLVLHEFDPALQKYTGRSLKATVTYITSVNNPCVLSEVALHKDYCILSIRMIGGVQIDLPKL